MIWLEDDDVSTLLRDGKIGKDGENGENGENGNDQDGYHRGALATESCPIDRSCSHPLPRRVFVDSFKLGNLGLFFSQPSRLSPLYFLVSPCVSLERLAVSATAIHLMCFSSLSTPASPPASTCPTASTPAGSWELIFRSLRARDQRAAREEQFVSLPWSAVEETHTHKHTYTQNGSRGAPSTTGASHAGKMGSNRP